MSTYEAHFTPEAWVKGHAVEIDSEGPQTWDCTAYAEQHQDYLNELKSSELWMLGKSPEDGWLDTDDVFKNDPAAPQWVRDHRGPFSIRIYPKP